MLFRRRRKIAPGVPTDSMGDIAFLLIIFFILTTQFMQEGHIKLTLPKDAAIQEVDKSPVTVTLDKDGVVYVQGVKASADSVQALVGSLLTEKHNLVHFRCDAQLPRKIYEPILIEIAEAGGMIVPLGEKGAGPE